MATSRASTRHINHQSQKDTPRTSSTKVPSDLGIVTAASGRALKLSVLHMTSPFSLALHRDTQVKGIATSSLGWAMFSKVCLVESSQRRKWFTSSYSYSKNLSKIYRFVGFPNEIQTWRQIRPSQRYWYEYAGGMEDMCPVCVCKHLVTRCRIFRGHLLGKTTCLMLQLVLISDLHFPSLSDMFEFAFSTSKFTSRGAVHAWQSLPNEDTVSAWWYGKETSFPRTCF